MKIASRFVVGLVLFSIQYSQSVWAALPKDAQEFLNQIPKKKVTLDYVIGRAVQSADRFQALKTSLYAIEAPVFAARAPLETLLIANVSQEWNRNKPTTPFGTQRQENTVISLGISKMLPTGTGLGLELSQLAQDMDFGVAFGSVRSASSQLKVSLSQSLWKNFFGDSFRAGMKAGDKQREASLIEWRERFDDLVLGVTQIFYQAWSQQAQVKTSVENLARRERLFQIVKARYSRGTAEKPDYISAESSLKIARLTLKDHERQLREVWQSLITSLKLPAKWVKIDPYEIPIEPHQELKLARNECAKKMPEDLRALEKVKLQKEQSDLTLDQIKSTMRPDLSVRASLVANGALVNVADAFDTRWLDAIQLRNPAYTVGVSWSMPLDHYAEKAQLAQAYAQSERMTAELSMTGTDLENSRSNLCSEIALSEQMIEEQKKIVEAQRERAQLEEARYKRASLSVYNVIQAGDELGAAEYTLRLYEVKARLTAWNILKMKGLEHYLEGAKLHE